MNESPPNSFTNAVVNCLLQNDSSLPKEQLRPLVAWVLGEEALFPSEEAARKPLLLTPSRADMSDYLAEIRKILPEEHDRIALVNGGATKIKGYVFEAPKLPEIRGASALLDWVNDVGLRQLWRTTLGNELGNDAIIYASGGGFLAFAPANEAQGQDLATAIEHCYTEHTLTANSVAVSATFSLLELRYGRLRFDENGELGYWADEFERDWANPELRKQLAVYYYGNDNDSTADRFFRRKTFGELVTLLATMTDRRRNERATFGETRNMPFYQLAPWDAKCQSSDVRPAVVEAKLLPNSPAMSQTAAKKAYIGRKVKSYPEKKLRWYTDVFGNPIETPISWEEQFKQHPASAVYYKSTENDISPAQDVGEIGQASDPQGYIGIIYADGNNVGRSVAKASNPRRYQELSQKLDEASYDAVFSALGKHLRPAHVRNDEGVWEWVHPFEIITIGGDDILIIVPGSKALDIAQDIGLTFETKLKPVQSQPAAMEKGRYTESTPFSSPPYIPEIGLSAGVIIAQENAPIFFLRDLVEELLKSAKGLAKDNAKHGFYGGAVDFMVMKSITMVTDKIKAFRRQALGDDEPRRLTARPYTWHELAGLLQTVRGLKKAKVPRSQLYRLRRALDADGGTGITSSVMEYLYTRVRLRQAYGDALNKHIDQHWCWSTPTRNRSGGLPPWMPRGENRWETIWPDMLEAYEMVPDEVQQ